MTTYLIRDDELIDKDTMELIGYIEDCTQTLYIDYIEMYTAYPNTLIEIIHDYPTYELAPFTFCL